MDQSRPRLGVLDSPVASRTTEPAEFVPAYPWEQGLEASALSTRRGFVFQYPPFPTLPQVEPGAAVASPDTAGLYLHVPFCAYHCAYCYYAVEVNQSGTAVNAYLGQLEREMDLVVRRPGRPLVFRTVFFGGGTPTYLDGAQLGRVITALGRRFDLSAVEEFTVESDPTTIDHDKAAALRGCGVNRLSIGVQSFSTELNLLNERQHTTEQTMAALATARAAGFDNINLDLICGLIGETERSWHDSVDRLMELSPEHVTIYLFSLRPQTHSYLQLRSGRLPAPPDEELRIAMYLHGRQRLLDAGYVQTTPNCFARTPRHEQAHQRNAWSSLPLIGLGNSAYSFFDDCVTQNHRSVNAWSSALDAGRIPVEVGRRLTAREQIVRYCVLRLKQLSVVRSHFHERFGFDVTEVLGGQIERLVALGLVQLDDQALRLTTTGIIYVDDVCRAVYGREVQAALGRMEAPVRPLVKSLV